MAHFKANYGEIRDWSIYKIVSPTNRVYIGLTSNIKRRYNDYAKFKCLSQTIVYKSIIKYGFESHTFEVIDTFKSDTNFAYGKEIFWIRTYMSNCSRWPEFKGLNAVDGGRGCIGYKMSDETRLKLRDANLGKKYSEETKIKLSKLRKGKKIKSGWTEEKKQEMRETKLRLGYRHTEETKRKISQSGMGKQYMLGRKQSAESIEKRASKLRGRALSKGRKASDETKKKMSEARGKAVLQYNKNGDFIAEHKSIKDAAIATQLSRGCLFWCLSGRSEVPRKYIFKFKPTENVIYS